MSTIVTGSAGFIGYHVCRHLLNRGDTVIGIDNLNPYYDVRLKEARLQKLREHKNFTFHQIDIADREATHALFNSVHSGRASTHSSKDSATPSTSQASSQAIKRVVHLAAQAGVRYSLTHPFAYSDSNLVGHLVILEACRMLPQLEHLVYASSSSVYGANQKLPFSVHDPVDQPISLYAATKRACELMSYTYSHLHGMPITGLRFFTVYGPWGRPDMSAFLFTKAILEGNEISVFNHGDMRRNFTYIDDIVQGAIGCLDNPPNHSSLNILNNAPSGHNATSVPHRVYNIGNGRSEPLMHFIETLEKIIGKKAMIRFEAMQPGDVKETIADIQDTTRDFGFIPKTNIEEGLANFVEWYRSFYNV